MTDTYKATPEQWDNIEGSAYGAAACILELRARVEALEAQASSREVAEPAPVIEGLVARVAYAISPEVPKAIYPEARAAILEVATWLSERGWEGIAALIDLEAGR